MKLTRETLKSLIKEELGNLDEEFGSVGAGEARKAAMAGSKELAAGGVTNAERGIIQNLQSLLVQAAQMGNIAGGRVARLATMLRAELTKIVPQEESADGELSE